jgi:site-specific DNA recombinase
MVKRIIIYLRVSSDEQTKNNSLSVQHDDCKAYTEQHGFEVVAVLREDYTGTVPIEQRPEGRKAYEMLKMGAADGLLVWKMNRLVRPLEDGDEWAVLPLIQGLAKLGKEIHICDRGQIRNDFASLMLAVIDAREAGNDRRAILEKMTKGMSKKAQNGRSPCTGQPPYGYRFVIASPGAKRPDALEIYEPEASQVKRIYNLYLHGDGNGPLTYRAIAELLSLEGIPSPGVRKNRPNQKRKAGMWTPSTVARMINNPAYKGSARFGKRGTYKKGQRQSVREDSELIAYPAPAIIDAETWTHVQARSEANKRLSERNSHRQYLIGGMIHCTCGYHMTGECTVKPSGETRYYRCNARGGFVSLEPRHRHRVNADRAEAAAWDFLLEVVKERDKLYSRLTEAQAQALAKLEPQRDQLDSINAMIADTEKEAEQTARAMRAIPQTRHSGATYRALDRQSAEIDEQYAGLLRARDKVEAEIAAATITDESIEGTCLPHLT